MEDEATTHVEADQYEQTRGPQGHRNGHYTRDFVTTHGPLPKLRVPRLLEGGMDFNLFDKYQAFRETPGTRSAPPTSWSGPSGRSGAGCARWASSPTPSRPSGSCTV